MTISEWIDRREHAVPAQFRPWLAADGPVSRDSLLDAAGQELKKCAAHSPRDRRAAFHLLAADAYVTYACMLDLTEGADGHALEEVARRVAQGWWERLR